MGCTNIQRIYRGCIDVQGHTDVWGCTDVWEMYRSTGRCMGPYRHMGDVWGLHAGGVQMYMGDVVVWGVQMYRRYTEVWKPYRYMRCIDVGSYRHPQTYRQLEIPPHPFQLHLGTIFLIKFKFVAYRHILLAYQLALQHSNT